MGNSVSNECCIAMAIGVTFLIVLSFGLAYIFQEGFKDSTQPLVFTKNYKIGPANCTPYSGSHFPSSDSNPIDLNTGHRRGLSKEYKDSFRKCEKAWRDCSAYQDCINGRCENKDHLKN